MTFQKIASAYPDRVQVLFSRYGITQPVSGESLLSNSLIFGDSFVDELIEEIEKNENFFIGSGILGSKIKLGWAKAKELFRNNKEKIGSGKSGVGKKIFQGIVGLFGDNTEEVIKPDTEAPKDNKMLIYGGLGLIVIIVLFLAFK